jgi:hypothetical protein
MTTILFFLCSLRTLSVGWDETNPFTLFSLLFFLYFLAAMNRETRTTKDVDSQTECVLGMRHLLPP